jgi:metal-responsive CopG/Arc/MetJ family transcriptional regulator
VFWFWYYGVMAIRKMTFSFPEDLAARFVRAVPSRNRSRYIADLIESKMHEREKMLIEACEAANLDPETREIEREMDALPDTMAEEWDDDRKVSATR